MPTADALLLGVDIGTTAVKVVLLDHQGQPHGSARAPTPFYAGEMAPLDLRAAVGRAIGLLNGADRARVAAVGIAGLAESGAPLDARGRPQAPVIAWNDPRGAEVVDRLRGRLGEDLDRAIGQRLRTVSSVAKLGWLLDHGVGPVTRWLGVPELVLEALTGCQATEYSLAARTGAYHLGERRYLPEVVDALGMTRGTEVFPPVVAAGTDMGRVCAEGAQWSGLPVGIPVTLAGHDHFVGGIGSGAGPQDVANSVGTAETVLVPASGAPDVDRARALRVAVTLLPGGTGMALITSAVRSGLAVEAVAGALGCLAGDLDARAAADAAVAGGATAAQLRAAAAVQPGAAPVGDEIVEAALGGQPLELSGAPVGEVWRAVVDALAGRTWAAVDRLQQVACPPGDGGGRPSGSLVVFGGGSRSQLWMQAKARGRPEVAVWRSPAQETVARGAALYAGVAAGWWPSPGAGPGLTLERFSFR